MSRSRHTRRPAPGNADTKADARTERRATERAALMRALHDPEPDVVLPPRAGDPWSWT